MDCGFAGKVRCCFQPMTGHGKDSGALQDPVLSLSPGRPAHPPARRLEGLEGPGEKAVSAARTTGRLTVGHAQGLLITITD